MTRYRIGSDDYASNGVTFQSALESAYKNQVRPLCLCSEPGLPMYIAHLDRAYVVKRMPYTGADHAPGCESYEAPSGLSGRGEVDGQAIEHDDAGTVNLKLAFSLRHNNPVEKDNESIGKTTAKTSGTRLTLRGLLHYLWDESKLSHWQPEMQGRRSWFAVRNALLDAVKSKETKSAALNEILYIPEVFDKAKRNDIANRRIRSLAPIMGPGKSGKKLMLLVGEVDSISEAAFGFALRVKHLPDFPLVMDTNLRKNYNKVFKSTINLCEYTPKAHSIVIATFVIDDKGIPSVEEMCIMLTSPEWIPLENGFDRQLVEQLVAEKRSFQKQLRYNLPTEKPIASVVLTDSDNAPLAMYIDVGDLVGKWASTVAVNEVVASSSVQTWMWEPKSGVQPELPPKKGITPQPRHQVDETPAATEEAAATPPGDELAISQPDTVVAAAQADERRGTVTPIKNRPTVVATPKPVRAPVVPLISMPITPQGEELVSQ